MSALWADASPVSNLPSWARAGASRAFELWRQAQEVWVAGGWAMYGIAAVAVILFGMGVHLFLSLRRRGFSAVPESIWQEWITEAARRRGPIGELLDFVGAALSLDELTLRFAQLRALEMQPFERDLRLMKVCVGAAPLIGLLGTVTGMLATFKALATGTGGEQTMGLIAAGISEALITTETGLVVALPGMFFQYQMARKLERYRVFLAHLETATTQSLHKSAGSARRVHAARVAARRVARALLAGRAAPESSSRTLARPAVPGRSAAMAQGT